MQALKGNSGEAGLWHQIKKYALITLGSAIYAVGFQYFMFPNQIVSGGLTGIAMIINRFTDWPVGMMILAMNTPLFLIAWRHFGLDYLLGSLAGTAISSVLVDILAATSIVATDDPMLASVIGGVIKGAGMGMIYYVGASTGGVDIVVTHAPVRGWGDLEDLPHRGFKCFDKFVRAVRPRILVHGHVHMTYGHFVREREHESGTRLLNAYEYCYFDI